MGSRSSGDGEGCVFMLILQIALIAIVAQCSKFKDTEYAESNYTPSQEIDTMAVESSDSVVYDYSNVDTMPVESLDSIVDEDYFSVDTFAVEAYDTIVSNDVSQLSANATQSSNSVPNNSGSTPKPSNNTTFTNTFEPSTEFVYVCTGPNAYAYHSDDNCSGLNRCRYSIVYISKTAAIQRYHRRYCHKCY